MRAQQRPLPTTGAVVRVLPPHRTPREAPGRQQTQRHAQTAGRGRARVWRLRESRRGGRVGAEGARRCRELVVDVMAGGCRDWSVVSGSGRTDVARVVVNGEVLQWAVNGGYSQRVPVLTMKVCRLPV